MDDDARLINREPLNITALYDTIHHNRTSRILWDLISPVNNRAGQWCAVEVDRKTNKCGHFWCCYTNNHIPLNSQWCIYVILWRSSLFHGLLLAVSEAASMNTVLSISVTKCRFNVFAKHPTFIHWLSGNVTFVNPYWRFAAHSCELWVTESWIKRRIIVNFRAHNAMCNT